VSKIINFSCPVKYFDQYKEFSTQKADYGVGIITL